MRQFNGVKTGENTVLYCGSPLICSHYPPSLPFHAPVIITQHTIPPPTFKFPPTPDVQDCLADPSLPTNQISPSWSRDTFITPPPISSEGSSPVVTVEMTKSPHQSSKLPLKSALRRSERLRKSGTTVASAQRKVGISNLVHVSVWQLCPCLFGFA